MTTITSFEKKVFNYLNDLRESGATNMFGAGAYIVERFDIDKRQASEILSKWMDNFNNDGYEHLKVVD